MKNPPEYRPFRLGVLVAYIVLAGFICLCLLIGGYRGARARMGTRPPPTPATEIDRAAVAGCLHELERLYGELTYRLDATLASTPARRSSVEWEDWSPVWRTQLLAVGARCRLEEGDVANTAAVKEVYDRLIALHRHFTTLAVQFSKEIGPYSDELQRAMERARGSVAGAAP